MYKLKVNSCDGIYNNSIDVRFTKACDNNCSFCIEKTGLESLGKTNVNKLIESTIKLIKEEKKNTILILGGEPFLQPEKLLLYIKGIREQAEFIYITTSLPKTIKVEDETIIQILSLIDGLNVSLQHFDSDKNNEMLVASSKHNRIGLLSDLLRNYNWAKKIRVSINLSNGFIDSKEKLTHFLFLLKKIGCKKVKINELQQVSEDVFVSFEDIMNIELDSAFASGCQTDISDILQQYEMEITLKRSCFFVKDKNIATASFRDLMKVFHQRMERNNKKENGMKVLYENGDISNNWKTKKEGQESMVEKD